MLTKHWTTSRMSFLRPSLTKTCWPKRGLKLDLEQRSRGDDMTRMYVYCVLEHTAAPHTLSQIVSILEIASRPTTHVGVHALPPMH